ncbi:metallophosphoesterase, partial [Pelobium sp.]
MKRRISLLPIIILLAVLVWLNGYVMSGLSVIFPNHSWQNPFIITVILVNLSFLTALLRLAKSGTDTFFKVAVHAFMTVFVAELVYAIPIFMGDVYRLFASILGYHAANGAFLLNRFPVFSWMGLAASLLIILSFTHGMIWGKYAYRVIKQTLYFDDLPSAFDGFTLAQISDVHAGSFTNAKSVQKGIDLIKSQNADLFVFTGDLVNNKAEEIKPWINHFSQIKTNYGQFSILGNHDYGDYVNWNSELEKAKNLQTLKKHHQEIGFKLLLDEHIVLEKDGSQIVLAGVENWGKGFGERGDLEKALNQTKVEDFKI